MPTNQSLANPANIILCGKTRFTLLSDRMLRCEWAEDEQFEDRATLKVVNRRVPAVAFTKELSSETLRISTKYLDIELKLNGKKLSKIIFVSDLNALVIL